MQRCYLALLYLAPLAAAHAEIIDRIAVSVGNRVITTGDVNREIRVTALMNGSKLDLSPAAKRAAAERLVEQELIRRELDLTKFSTPDADAAFETFLAFRKTQFPNDAAYQRALQEDGITEQDVKEEMLWQTTLLNFLDVRFRPGVQVNEQDLHDYFDKTVRPVAEAASPGKAVRFEDYRDRVEATLTGNRADQEMDQWLKEARKRTDIIFHEDALK